MVQQFLRNKVQDVLSTRTLRVGLPGHTCNVYRSNIFRYLGGGHLTHTPRPNVIYELTCVDKVVFLSQCVSRWRDIIPLNTRRLRFDSVSLLSFSHSFTSLTTSHCVCHAVGLHPGVASLKSLFGQRQHFTRLLRDGNSSRERDQERFWDLKVRYTSYTSTIHKTF